VADIPYLRQFEFAEKKQEGERLALVSPDELRRDLELCLPQPKHHQLIDDVCRLAQQVEPMMYLTPTEPPGEAKNRETDTELGAKDEIIMEGRGVYHIIVVDNRPIILYVKGTGSPAVMQQHSSNNRMLPAFPIGVKWVRQLYHDQPSPRNTHPRIRGVLTQESAMVEYVESLLIFTRYLEDHPEIESLSQVMEAGIAFPLGVGRLPEISQVIQETKAGVAEHLDDSEMRKLVLNDGNEHLATVMMCVPSTQRYPLPEGDGDNAELALEQTRLSSTDYRLLGDRMRNMLAEQFTFVPSSIHGQNFYQSAMANFGIADAADTAAFELLTEVQVDNKNGKVTVSPIDHIAYVLQYVLTKQRGTSAPFYTTEAIQNATEEDMSYSAKKMIENAEAFLGAMLQDLVAEGIIHQDVIPILAQIAPFMYKDMSAALACLLAQHYYHQDRNNDRQTLRDLLAEKYEQKVPDLSGYFDPEDNYQKDPAFAHWHDLMAQPRFQAILRFLKKGNIEELAITEDAPLNGRLVLAKQILSMPPGETRETLFNEMSKITYGRELYDTTALSPDPDLLAQMNDVLFPMITDFLESGNTEMAVLTLQIFNEVGHIHHGTNNRYMLFPTYTGEVAWHHYINEIWLHRDDITYVRQLFVDAHFLAQIYHKQRIVNDLLNPQWLKEFPVPAGVEVSALDLMAILMWNQRSSIDINRFNILISQLNAMGIVYWGRKMPLKDLLHTLKITGVTETMSLVPSKLTKAERIFMLFHVWCIVEQGRMDNTSENRAFFRENILLLLQKLTPEDLVGMPIRLPTEEEADSLLEQMEKKYGDAEIGHQKGFPKVLEFYRAAHTRYVKEIQQKTAKAAMFGN